MPKLNALRRARARPSIGGGESGIIPNIVQAATIVSGITSAANVAAVAAVDTKSRAHYIEYTIESGPSGNVRPYVFGGATGSGLGFTYANVDRFAGMQRNTDGSITTGTYPVYQQFTTAQITAGARWQVGDKVRVEITPDKRLRYKINGVVVWDQDLAGSFDANPNNTFVGLVLVSAATVRDFTYGPYDVPIDVQNQTLGAGYVPSATINYTGTPYAYKVRIETSGGTPLTSYEDVVITNSTKGRLIVSAKTGAPISQFGSAVNVRWAEVDASGNVVRSFVASSQMPDQPAKFGMNISGEIYYGTERIYKDLAYNQAYYGSPQSGSLQIPTHIVDGGPDPTYFNDKGQITNLYPGGMTRRIIRCTYPGSRCRLEWKGYTITLNNDASAANRTSGTTNGVNWIEFDFNFNWVSFPNLMFTISAVDTAVTDRFFRCAEVGTVWNGEVFCDEFISRMSQFTVLRYMDLMGSNASLPYGRNWDVSRPKADFYGGQPMGMPFEHIVELSNRTNTIPWINLPAIVKTEDAAFGYQYTVKAVRALLFGELMIGGVKLNPTLAGTAAGRMVVEIGNEWFNSAFSIYHSAAQTSYDDGRATSAQYNSSGRYEAVLVEEAYQVNRHFQALTDSLTTQELQSIVRVLGHNPNTYSFRTMTETGAPPYRVEAGNYDAITCAFYFGAGMNNAASTSGAYNAYTTDLDTLFARYDADLTASYNNTLTVKQYAKSKGKRFIMYEGQGHYIAGSQGTGTEWYNPTLYAAFQQDDRQRIAIRKWANLAASGFGDIMCAYSSIGSNGPSSAQYGQWGFLTNAGAPNSSSVKMQGYMQAKADQGV